MLNIGFFVRMEADQNQEEVNKWWNDKKKMAYSHEESSAIAWPFT